MVYDLLKATALSIESPTVAFARQSQLFLRITRWPQLPFSREYHPLASWCEPE
jgi:hypothetical protein